MVSALCAVALVSRMMKKNMDDIFDEVVEVPTAEETRRDRLDRAAFWFAWIVAASASFAVGRLIGKLLW